MDINYDYYKIFYYVAKYQNITQAADILGSNQPNVSRVLKLLEHEFGCSLCHRTNRGIVLTPEGEKLYSRIRIAIEQIKLAESEIGTLVNLSEGKISIGASETALYMTLLPALNTFRTKYPDIQIRIQNHLTSEAIQSVKEGLVDFSVVALGAELPSGLNATKICDCHDILIGGNVYKAAKCMDLEGTTHMPIVSLSKGSATYDYFLKLYSENGLLFSPELEAATTDQILPMVKNNLGIGFIPSVYAVEALSKGDVFEIKIKEDIPPRQICLIENPEYPLSVASSMLKNILLHT